MQFLDWGHLVQLQPDRFALRRIQQLPADYLLLGKADGKHSCFWMRGIRKGPVFYIHLSYSCADWKHTLSDLETPNYASLWLAGRLKHQPSAAFYFLFFYHNGFSWTIDKLSAIFMDVLQQSRTHYYKDWMLVWKRWMMQKYKVKQWLWSRVNIVKMRILPLLLCKLSVTRDEIFWIQSVSAAKQSLYYLKIYLKPPFN